MTNDQARQYFKELGLKYTDIKQTDIEILNRLIDKELTERILSGDGTAISMNMKAGKLLKKNIRFENGELKSAFLTVDGSFFSKRESVSFNNGGFIGFAGWADSFNSEPILKSFCDWCDWLKRGKGNERNRQ
jgi:hypothetical protein